MMRLTEAPTFAPPGYRLRAASLYLGLSVGLAGCVGPVFHPSTAPEGAGYGPVPKATVPAPGGIQDFTATDIPKDWWQLFNSPALSALVAQALADNPSLQATTARLGTAMETARASRGGLFPSLDLNFSPTRQKESNAELGVTPGTAFEAQGVPTTLTLISAQAQVSYTFDVWGSIRHGVEQANANAEQQRFALIGARNMLAANAATLAITAASLRAQIAAQNSIIEAQTKTLNMVRAQFEAGAATGADVATQEAAQAASLTVLPALRADLAKTNHALGAALGQTPQQAQLPDIKLEDIRLPQHLPLSLPSQLVAQRPDLRAADATLHAAVAALDIAIANRLPQISLNAAIGSEPSQFSNLFTPGNGVWTLGGQILAPVFHGGTLKHQEAAARDTARAAALTYRDTAINAFTDVANVLSALDEDAKALAAADDAARAADKSLDLATIQYRSGSATYLTVLTSLGQAQNARINLIKARAARLSDSIALYIALGGGWWHDPKFAQIQGRPDA